jgi:amidase
LCATAAAGLARMIRSRELSATELLEATLAQIDAVNPALNAIVKVLGDEARAEAAAADRKLAAGEKVGPLHGVPFTVKENIDMAGLPTTWGVPALAQAITPMDAPVVERMRAAGAIPIGRTNLPDMALRIHTNSSLHGLTRNPWHSGRTAGGSSGGEGSALASGMSPIGLGNDIGGSLRNPANACGIASIRPSAGRVPDAGFVPTQEHLLAVQLMNVQGPMARRVADVRLGLRVLMGAHPRDPWSIDAPFEGPAVARPLRVAVIAEPSGGSTNPVIAATVRRAAKALADAGYVVEEVSPPRYEEAIGCWARLIMGDFRAVLPQLSPLMGADALTFLNKAIEAVPPLGGILRFDGRTPWRRAGMVGLHGRTAARAVADLDTTALRARLRLCNTGGNGRGHGNDAPGDASQSAGPAFSLRPRRSRRSDGIADRRSRYRSKAARGFVS